MITRVYAEGFRSLDQFAIDLVPGLNVLVGPNGGGKTNILALFSFISAVARDELGEAINVSGGASKVFKKTGPASFVKELLICVSGELKHNRRYFLPGSYERRLRDAGFIGLKYEWTFRIDSSLGYDETFYSEQVLRAKLITSTLFTVESNDWDIEILCRSKTPQGIDVTERVFNDESALLIHQNPKRAAEDETVFVDMSEDGHTSSLPIFLSVGGSYVLRLINRDLQGGTTFNFDPAVCKLPNDSAQSPSLEKNGNGLASTIYAIQKSTTAQPRSPYVYSNRRMYNPVTSKSLQEYFRLINPAVGAVKARNNPFDNKIVVQFSISSDQGLVDFPLDLASDGTVKWLAFTVALLTQRSGFSIEEPENFLHPDIQRHAIELVRTETDESEGLYVLMTTHSETLLNASRPEELIIVSMIDGVTSAKRINDPSLIDNEIRETGFGLGYYYISGALND